MVSLAGYFAIRCSISARVSPRRARTPSTRSGGQTDVVKPLGTPQRPPPPPPAAPARSPAPRGCSLACRAGCLHADQLGLHLGEVGGQPRSDVGIDGLHPERRGQRPHRQAAQDRLGCDGSLPLRRESQEPRPLRRADHDGDVGHSKEDTRPFVRPNSDMRSRHSASPPRRTRSGSLRGRCAGSTLPSGSFFRRF
jgi:hypothetical protein